jgi:hypothetical protein
MILFQSIYQKESETGLLRLPRSARPHPAHATPHSTLLEVSIADVDAPAPMRTRSAPRLDPAPRPIPAPMCRARQMMARAAPARAARAATLVLNSRRR